MRKTHTVVQVAAALMDNPSERHWGNDVAKKSGVRPGALYPVLARMHAAGWLADEWEESAAGKNRPPRRYYEITEQGRVALATLLAEARREKRFASLDLNHDDKVTEG